MHTILYPDRVDEEGTAGGQTVANVQLGTIAEGVINILLLEDNPSDAELLDLSFKSAHLPVCMQRVETRNEFVQLLEEFSPDVILADYALPHFDAVAALQLMQQMGLRTPFILVSGAVGDERAVEILKLGATDYVLKDRLVNLAPSIRRALVEAEERASRLAAEALLRQQTELYLTLLQAQSDMGVGMLLLDGDRYLFVNDAYCTLTGCSREELLALPSVSVLPAPERSREYMDRLERTGQGESVEGLVESAIIRKDGRYIDVEASAKVLQLDGRSVRLAIVRDITERKRAEADVREFANKLEQSNRDLEQFAFAASHDLQEPLRKIQAFGTRLKDRYAGQLGKDGSDSLDYMLDAARRLEAMIKGVLILSRIGTKGNPFQRVDLSDVVREVLADLELRIEQTGAQMEIGDLHTVDADPAQMRQLLQNLIANALKFREKDVAPLIKVHGEALETEEGKDHLTTYLTTSHLTTDNLAPLLETQPAPGHATAPAYRIIVEDNGVGFDTKFLHRIFMPFQRLHTASEYEGTGMGLAICRKIVERHNGKITATSAPGCGAKFIITLPSTSAERGRTHESKKSSE